MLILALETSQTAGGVALLNDGELVVEHPLATEARSARTLAPAMTTVLNAAGVTAQQLGLIAVTRGPGSFTGLRIGVTAAKTAAWSLGIPLVAVETTNVLAAQVVATCDRSANAVRVAIDAFRKEVFAAEFHLDEMGKPQRVGETRLQSVDDWIAGCGPDTIVTGPIVTRLLERLPAGAIVVPPAEREPRAATVGRLAYREFLTGRRDDPFQLTPLYLRPSYAEEARAVKS
ncbi:MAG: tRNA (adenosine(37)-N6)-threonylcarbamoyltransferase complex dimerization subunit type 1 TsaB [Pirellulales bacterium]